MTMNDATATARQLAAQQRIRPRKFALDVLSCVRAVHSRRTSAFAGSWVAGAPVARHPGERVDSLFDVVAQNGDLARFASQSLETPDPGCNGQNHRGAERGKGDVHDPHWNSIDGINSIGTGYQRGEQRDRRGAEGRAAGVEPLTPDVGEFREFKMNRDEDVGRVIAP